jgi:hypothetical protein
MRLTTTLANPALIAAAAKPTLPAAPPPPEVSVAEKRISGMPRMPVTEPGSTGAIEYKANPSISCTPIPASSQAAMIALHANSIGV